MKKGWKKRVGQVISPLWLSSGPACLRERGLHRQGMRQPVRLEIEVLRVGLRPRQQRHLIEACEKALGTWKQSDTVLFESLKRPFLKVSSPKLQLTRLERSSLCLL